jgi:subtilisin-like proprotein convertase family protein
VIGLAGSGLVLQLNAAGTVPVSAASFTFPNGLTSNTAYNVTVAVQPTNPSQTCTVVANGSGTIANANVSNVSVSCATNSFTVGGTVDVLTGTGLVLQNNGASNLTIGANGLFVFLGSLLSGTGYNVTVLSQPTGQTCTVSNGSGTVGAGNVTSVDVACTFSLGALDDPLVAQQWHLRNTGQTGFADNGGTPGMDIRVDPVFGLGITGRNVTVAVIDSGLEIAHEDLAANVISGGSWNFNFPASGNSQTDPTNTIDIDGDHGTSVAGLIAMAAGNGKGGIGVAPHARLKGFNFLNMPTPTETAFLDSIGASSAQPNSRDVAVFNQSFGISTVTPIAFDPNDPEEAQYRAGVTTLRGGMGALYVKAAGNGFGAYTDTATNQAAACSLPTFDGQTFIGLSCENANMDPGNTLPYQIVVGATNALGVRATYSTPGSAIWVSAPGGQFGRNQALNPGFNSAVYSPAMVTTDQSGCKKGFSTNTVENLSYFDDGLAVPPSVVNLNPSCSYTNRMNGTSSATPVAAGVVALMLEANPALTWRDVKHILAKTARQIDTARADFVVFLPNPAPNSAYIAEPGWITNPAGFNFHNWYGFGMVDASAAVTMAKTYAAGQWSAISNTGFVSSASALGLVIPDDSITGATNAIVVTTAMQFAEAVQIKVNVTHPAAGDLGIELTSPLGTRSVLKTIRDGFGSSPNLTDMVLSSNAFYGVNPAGTWRIKVVDGKAGPAGTQTLNNWAIRIYGH